MPNLNPLEASQNIIKSYRDYLLSLNEFSDERIDTEFAEVLSNGFSLSKGPFVQSTPPYSKSKTIQELVDDGILRREFLILDQEVMPRDRPLYQHQVEAIEKVAQNRNLIIATGTGSGKTESFLLPIVNRLLEERDTGTLSQSGVRAMLLYPMNALANDQMQRIRDLLGPFPDITFGRYIGDTELKTDEANRKYKQLFGEEPQSNELVSRQEMQENPPHILVTNFAMLEYLLLRPEDTSLFDGNSGRHWKFMVLDEVHTYQGAQGGEISMLLKRVRDRVNKSQKGIIQYIGTSATIGQTDEDLPKLVKFGSLLFDENFEYDSSLNVGDIIRPKFQAETKIKEPWSASLLEIRNLHKSFFESDMSDEVLQTIEARLGWPITGLGDVQSRLGALLLNEVHVQTMKSELFAGAKDVAQLSTDVFAGEDALDEIRMLIDLCVLARIPGEEHSLLGARYHLMLRALEGLFYCFNPDHPAEKARLFLERREECPDCSTDKEKVVTFELGPCSQCGATYIIGQKVSTPNGGEFVSIGEQFDRDLVYLTEVPISSGAVDDEDEDIVEIPDEGQDVRELCRLCGSLGENRAPCSHDDSLKVKVLHSVPKEPGSPLRKCGICSGRTTGSMVNRVQTGQDAPGAVIATAIYQALPPLDAPKIQRQIGQGRKLLCFSDSRQDAAFFAPYLDRNYSRVVQRRLIMHVLADREEPLRFNDLVEPIRREALNRLVLDSGESNEFNSVEVRKWLMREVLATDRRLSLSGIGLVNIRPLIPNEAVAPNCLTSLGLSEKDAIEVVVFLLNTLREQGAVHIPDGVKIDDPIFAPRNLITKVRQLSEKGVIGWTPRDNRSNRRSAYLDKIIEMLAVNADSSMILDELWVELFTTNSSPWANVLEVTPESGLQVLRLNWKAIEFSAWSKENSAYICRICKQVSWTNILNICTATRCSGTLETVEDENFRKMGYRKLYLNTIPTGMRVEEHTGQLSNDWAAKLQQGFVEGKVNVLSCSTTFELGVDLGEIQAVFLRNVPPSPANYVQRAGRAGRRLNSAALVTTFAQRRSHDLYYFESPSELVNGNVKAPQISSTNVQIIRRHVHSVAVAAFARTVAMRGEKWPKYVGDFFRPPESGKESMADEFRTWLESRPENLDEALLRIVAEQDMRNEIGIDDWSWVEALYEDSPESEKGWLARATEEVLEGFKFVEELIKQKVDELTKAEIGSKKRFAIAKTLKSLELQYNTLYGRFLLEFLAQRVVLPKYGFPVDVVSLDIWKPGDVEGAKLDLTRDLRMGILDFAPSANTVANKKLWVSTGLRRPADKALREFRWAICQSCNTFRRTPDSEVETLCGVCGDYEVKSGGAIAIRPTFGFLGEASEEKPGEIRPKKVGSVSSYFSDFAGTQPELEFVSLGSFQLRVRMGKQGLITVLNRGPRNGGFEICLQCGFARVPPIATKARRNTTDRNEQHERPGFNTGTCSSSLKRRFLGHEYLTDTIEIQVPGLTEDDTAWSVLSALLGATHVLGISPRDLEGTIRASGPRGSERALVIFDSVPGGAGYSRSLKEQLEVLFQAAFHLTMNCHCGEETACYGCLKTYGNQGHHEVLSRRAALELFTKIGLN